METRIALSLPMHAFPSWTPARDAPSDFTDGADSCGGSRSDGCSSCDDGPTSPTTATTATAMRLGEPVLRVPAHTNLVPIPLAVPGIVVLNRKGNHTIPRTLRLADLGSPTQQAAARLPGASPGSAGYKVAQRGPAYAAVHLCPTCHGEQPPQLPDTEEVQSGWNASGAEAYLQHGWSCCCGEHGKARVASTALEGQVVTGYLRVEDCEEALLAATSVATAYENLSSSASSDATSSSVSTDEETHASLSCSSFFSNSSEVDFDFSENARMTGSTNASVNPLARQTMRHVVSHESAHQDARSSSADPTLERAAARLENINRSEARRLHIQTGPTTVVGCVTMPSAYRQQRNLVLPGVNTTTPSRADGGGGNQTLLNRRLSMNTTLQAYASSARTSLSAGALSDPLQLTAPSIQVASQELDALYTKLLASPEVRKQCENNGNVGTEGNAPLDAPYGIPQAIARVRQASGTKNSQDTEPTAQFVKLVPNGFLNTVAWRRWWRVRDAEEDEAAAYYGRGYYYPHKDTLSSAHKLDTMADELSGASWDLGDLVQDSNSTFVELQDNSKQQQHRGPPSYVRNLRTDSEDYGLSASMQPHLALSGMTDADPQGMFSSFAFPREDTQDDYMYSSNSNVGTHDVRIAASLNRPDEPGSMVFSGSLFVTVSFTSSSSSSSSSNVSLASLTRDMTGNAAHGLSSRTMAWDTAKIEPVAPESPADAIVDEISVENSLAEGQRRLSDKGQKRR